uniref:RNase H type-1 domain-containing protein n=1 Tax=Cannabis sativa TaxID=3483 RepID=A0A803PZF8_CANSA
MVSSLFHVHDRSWDDSLIRDMFNTRDVSLTLGIPLSLRATNDHWAWIGEKTGHYSVKSAYNLLQLQKNNRPGENNSGFWPELFPYANSAGTIGQWLHHVFTSFDDDISCRAVMLCWALWKARNTLVWNKKASSPSQVLCSAWTTLDHWCKAQDKMCLLSSSLLGDSNSLEQWMKLATNTIKINVDGATFEKDNAYGFGVVACDSDGKVIDFVAKYSHGSYFAEVVEALGVKKALSWLKGKSWNMVEVETDSLLTVQAIFSNQQVSSVFGLITNDCKILLSFLPNTSLRFIRRSANKVAHFVVRRSYFYSDRSIQDVDVLVDFQTNL